LTEVGFESSHRLGHGTLYVGRTLGWWRGPEHDCDGDGKPDATFASVCRFVVQLHQGKILVPWRPIEARTVQIAGKRFNLSRIALR